MNRLQTFLAQADFNKPSAQLALDLIFVTNQIRIPITKIVFGQANALDQRPDISDDPNTFVPVQVDHLFDIRFTTNDGFMYRRLPFTTLTPDPDVTIFPPFFPFKTSDVLDQINAQLGTQLTIDDLVEREYAKTDTVFPLAASPHSLPWIGVINLNVDTGEPLVPLVDNPFLTGFTPYSP